MAIISSIQKHAYILVLIIAIALITFLFEFINPNLGFLNSKPTYIGKVNGEELTYEDFSKEVDALELQYQNSKGSNLTETEINEIKSQVWNNFLIKYAVSEPLAKAGLVVPPKELVEVTTGTHIDPSMKQIPAFLSNGNYDPMAFKNFLRTLGQDDPGTAPGTKRRQWAQFENQLKNNRQITKFNSLIANGMYVPKWMLNYEKNLNEIQTDIQYVAVPYTSVDTASLKIDDAGMKAYFEKHKKALTPIFPTVKVTSVYFALQPSTADSVEIFAKFDEKMKQMQSETNDTAFFRAYGDKGYDSRFYRGEDLAEDPKVQEIMSSGNGSVVGPYINKDQVKAVKILNKKNIADSVMVQTITVSFRDAMQNQQAVNARMKLVDSIFKLVDTLHMNFDQIAQQMSSDRGQGLQPIWIYRQDKTWSGEIFDYGGSQKFFKAPSDREGVVRILKVVNYPATIPAVQLGEISTPYAPSTETQNAIYNTAQSFMEKNKTASDFEKNYLKFPGANLVTSMLTQNNRNLDGVNGNAREVVRWAFDSKMGDVSSMTQVGSNYVISINQGLRSKDHLEFDEVKDDVKAQYRVDLIRKAALKKLEGNSLQDIATKNQTTVGTAAGVSVSAPQINSIPEYNVVAASGVCKPNVLSKPIEGNGAAYRILVTKSTPKPVSPSDELQINMQLNQQQKTVNSIVDGLVEDADIKDNRVNMY